MKFFFEVQVEVTPDGEYVGFTDMDLARDYDYKVEGLIADALDGTEADLHEAAESNFEGVSGVEVSVNRTVEEW